MKDPKIIYLFNLLKNKEHWERENIYKFLGTPKKVKSHIEEKIKSFN